MGKKRGKVAGIILTGLLTFQMTSFSVSVSANEGNSSLKSRPSYVQDQVIVKFKTGVVAAQSTEISKKFGLVQKQSLPSTGARVMNVKSGKSVEEVIQELKRNPAIQYAQPNYIYYSQSITPDDSRWNEQWGLHNTGQTIAFPAFWDVSYSKGKEGVDINAPEAWETATQLRGVTVAVMDTGVDINHPDLKDAIWTNTGEIPNNNIDDDHNGFVDDVHGWDFANNDNTVFDSEYDDMHGTHVAGIIAAQANSIGVRGVAPNAKIMPLKILKNGWTTTDVAIKAMDYAAKMGVKISNNSWGGMWDSRNPDPYDVALNQAIEKSDMLFVAAAGNEALNTDSVESMPSGLPAENIISVAAVTNEGKLPIWSNYGLKTVDIAAPGEGIISTVPNGQYDYLSGTSMATPFVTGAAAVLLGQKDMTPVAMKNRLMETGTELPDLRNKVASGRMLNLYQAVASSTGQMIPVAGISLAKTMTNLLQGSQVQLQKNIAPYNATNKKVTWTSSNSEVVTVNEYGLVTAVKPGDATVTVCTEDGQFTDSVTFHVQLSSQVKFADPKLESIIREELHKQTGPIYAQDMQQLVELTAKSREITNLDGLQYAKKLQYLDLTDNQITDIAPLRSLVNLQHLNLTSNRVQEIGPLDELIRLLEVSLTDNPLGQSAEKIIENMKSRGVDVKHSPLNKTNVVLVDKQLEQVIRDALNKPTDPITFKDMASLTVLDADGKNVENIEGLEEAINLQRLFLNDNRIKDITPLSNLKSLVYVNLSSNEISDIVPLQELPSLGYVGLKNNPLNQQAGQIIQKIMSSGWGVLVEYDADTTAPTRPIVNVPDSEDMTVTGMAEPGSSLKVKGNGMVMAVGKADEDGSFAVELAKPQIAGTVIEVSAIDLAGNESEKTIVTVSQHQEEKWEVWKKQESVSKDKEWTIKLSSILNPKTIMVGKTVCVKDKDGNIVDVRIFPNEENRSIVISAPETGYKHGEAYCLYISSHIFSTTGKPLKEAIKMEFVIQ